MTVHKGVALCVVLAACSPSEPEGAPPPATSPPPIEPPSPPEPPPPPDTPPAPLGPPTNVTSTVHEQYGTLVYVSWEQSAEADAHVAYTFEDDLWLSSPVRLRGAGVHEEVLLGIPYGATASFHVVLERAGTNSVVSDDQVASTDTLPGGYPSTTLITFDEVLADVVNAPYLFTSLGQVGDDDWWVIIVDRLGRPVWIHRPPPDRTTLHVRIAKDGQSLFLDHDSYWTTFDASDGQVVQMLLDGTVLHTYDTPGLHHPFTDLPDGSVAWGAIEGAYANELLRVVHTDGTTETVFDCEEWLASEGFGGVQCGSNTLNYDPLTNRFLFSMFAFETILDVDRTTGAVERWFGHLGGSYTFDPPTSAFWWQHGTYVTDAGTLLLSSDRTSNGDETIVREYEIDAVNGTLREVWNFGLGEGVYGIYSGEAFRTPNGNTQHNYGDLARIREATPDKQVVWDVEWSSSYVGKSTPFADLYALVPDPI